MKLQFKNVSWLLLITTSMFLFISCTDHKKDEELITRMSASFSNSYKASSNAIQDLLASFQEKINDPATASKAKIWYTKATYIQLISERIISGIDLINDSLQNHVKNNFGYRNSKGILNRIIDSIRKYNGEVINTDPRIEEDFSGKLNFYGNPGELFFIDSSADNFYIKFSSATELICFLNMIKSNVVINEYRLIKYCYYQINIPDRFYEYYSAIIGQNAKIFEPHQKMEIIAGVGAFSKVAQPEIFVNGKNIQLADDATANYSFRVPSKPGKYSVPVKINYIDQDGKREVVEKNIEYKVVKEIGKE